MIPAPPRAVDADGHPKPLRQVERELIDYTIDLYCGRMSDVARALGIGRSTLYRKLREPGRA